MTGPRNAPRGEQPAASPPQVAAWFGLAAGLAEALFFMYRLAFTDAVLESPLDTIWMAPLVQLVLLSLVGIAYGAAAAALPRLKRLSTMALVFGFLATSLFLFQATLLHPLARVLLALGLAVQISRLVAANPDGFLTLVRLGFGWSALARREPGTRGVADPTRRDLVISSGIVVGALSLGLAGRGLTRRLDRRPARRGAARRPSVLLVVLDTVRSASLSLHGYVRDTSPTLAALAAESITFDRAIAQSSWTLPSHASFFTGRLPHELSTGWHSPLDSQYETLAERLRHLGHATAGFVANLNYTHAGYGLARGFYHYDDFQRNLGQAIMTTAFGRHLNQSHRVRDLTGYYQDLNRRTADDVVDAFLEWHRRLGGQPYFAFLNLYDAHDPYLPPLPWATRYVEERPRGHLRALEALSSREKFEIQAAYDGAIAYTDHTCGRLLRALRGRGDLEQTLLVVVSDHGEEFYEHGVVGHGVSLYLPSIHVPLQIRLPGGTSGGRRVAATVSLHDLPATILEVVEAGSGDGFPGHSLLAQTDDVASAGWAISEVQRRSWVPPNYPAALGDIRSIVAEGMHYIHNVDTGQEELYAIDRDYWEQDNLVSTSTGRRIADRLRHRLDDLVTS